MCVGSERELKPELSSSFGPNCYALEDGAGGNASAPEGAEGETGGHFEW